MVFWIKQTYSVVAPSGSSRLVAHLDHQIKLGLTGVNGSSGSSGLTGACWIKLDPEWQVLLVEQVLQDQAVIRIANGSGSSG
jgi:hypothetical protein